MHVDFKYLDALLSNETALKALPPTIDKSHKIYGNKWLGLVNAILQYSRLLPPTE